MDFGIGFLSNNVMLPFLDAFYGIVPSYGLAIVALTLFIRTVLFPISANQLRSMRRMKIANPVMQERMREAQSRYRTDPAKQQEEISKIYKEFGNPLSGCLPVLLQMPILFALFATLRGSPFADINYNVNFQIFPREQQAQIQPQAFTTAPQNVYFADRVHFPVQAVVAGGTNIVAGDRVKIDLQTDQGRSFSALQSEFGGDDFQPRWRITKGEERARILPDGTLEALQPGDVTVQATVPGLAANKGFLFIRALGEVGATNPDGGINWDVVVMVLGFGISLYVNQAISGNAPGGKTDGNQQQEMMNKVTPVIFSGMFLIFPLPAGVLLYMLVANVFQTMQAFLVSREPLPENLQRILDSMPAKPAAENAAIAPSKSGTLPPNIKAKKEAEKVEGGRSSLPFEPGSSKKKKS